MKRAITIITIALMTSFIYAQKQQDNKKIAIDILTESYLELERTVNELSLKELNYAPKDGGWSILNCLEHLTVVEPRFFNSIKKRIQENKVDKSKDLSSNDWLVISKVTDRTTKVVTPEPFRPQPEMKGKTREYFLSQIKAHRDNLITFIKDTDAELRHIFGPYPYGEADMIQQSLVVGAHMHRHTMQIKELIVELYPDRKEKANLGG